MELMLTEGYWIWFPFFLLPIMAACVLAARRSTADLLDGSATLRLIMIQWLGSIGYMLLAGYYIVNLSGAEAGGFGAFILLFLFCTVIYSILLGVSTHLLTYFAAGRDEKRSLIAGLIVGVLFPFLLLGCMFVSGVIYRQFSDARRSARILSEFTPPNIQPRNFGIVTPAGFRPFLLYDKRGKAKRNEILRDSWRSNPDLSAEIRHQQSTGYSMSSELASKPWDEMVEEAARELVNGLMAAGYEVYIGSALEEHAKLGGNWQTYHEPVIVGMRYGSMVHLVIVPNPRKAGSAPRIMVGIYVDEIDIIFKQSERENKLQPLEADGTAMLFDLRDGYFNDWETDENHPRYKDFMKQQQEDAEQ